MPHLVEKAAHIRAQCSLVTDTAALAWKHMEICRHKFRRGDFMKRFLGMSFAAAVFAVPLTHAMAADMAVKAPPAPVVMDSWTGFYAGLNGGGVWGRDHLRAAP